MQKRILISLAVTGGLALTGVAAVPALASGKSSDTTAEHHHHQHEDGFRAAGTVSAADGKALTITLAGRNSTTTTYAVSSTAKITVDRTVTALGDLPTGLKVLVGGTVADNTKTIDRIVGWTTVPTGTRRTPSASTSASPSSDDKSTTGTRKRRHHGHGHSPASGTKPTTPSTTPTTTPSTSPATAPTDDPSVAPPA